MGQGFTCIVGPLSTLGKDAESISREVPPKMTAWRVQRSQLRNRMRHQGSEDLIASDGDTVHINLVLSERDLEFRVSEFLKKHKKHLIVRIRIRIWNLLPQGTQKPK